MSWDGYITSLMGEPEITHVAICGAAQGKESVWATTENWSITIDEIKKLAGSRSDFGQNGVLIGGVKCRMLRDNLDCENMYCMDLKTAADAENNTYSICVGKTCSAFIIIKGIKDASGGQLSTKLHKFTSYLRECKL